MPEARRQTWFTDGARDGYRQEIALGAQLIIDPRGSANGGNPYYWYRGTRYARLSNVPGFVNSRASGAYAPGKVDDVVTNKVTCWSANPTEAAGFVGNPVNMSKSGDAASILSVVNDSSALAAAGLSGVCTSGKVYKLDNSAGSTFAQVSFLVGFGNLNDHNLSVWVRGSGPGGHLRTGYTAMSTGGFTLTANYTRISTNQKDINAGAKNASDVMWVQATPGSIVYFILPQLIERVAPISQDIVTQGASASAVVGRVDGLVWFGPNVLRETDQGITAEGAATNVTQSSQAFNTAQWTRRGAVTAADNSILAPDNTLTGSLITGLGASGTNDFYESAFGTAGRFANNAALAWSFYIRPVSTSGTLRITNAQSSTLGEFTVNMASLTPGVWQRVFAGHPAVTTAFAFVASATGIAGLQFSCTAGAPISFYLWGAQLETGSQATSYIPTTTTAVTRAADNPYITGLGAILGQFRTNLLTWSQDFTNAAWIKDGSVPAIFTADATTAPNGTLTADKIAAPVGVSAGPGLKRQSISVANATPHYYEIFLKYDGGAFPWVELTTFSGSVVRTWFNTQTGAFGTIGHTGASVEVAANGFYWVRVPFTTGATIADLYATIRPGNGSQSNVTGDGTSGFFAWQADLQPSSVPVDYIPTTTAAVTVGNPFTMAVEDGGPKSGAFPTRASASAATGAPIVALFSNGLTGGLYLGSTGSADRLLGGVGVNALKSAARIRPNDARGAVNNVLSSSFANTAPSGLDRVYLGVNSSLGAHLNGQIRKVVIYGDLTDAQLQAVTA